MTIARAFWTSLLLAAASPAAFAQAPHDGHAAPALPAMTPQEMAAADAMYQRYCALCHAPDRSGHANDHAPSLRSKSLLESGFPMIIAEAIAYGRPGTPMGAYYQEVGGPLSRDDIRQLTTWLSVVENVAPLHVHETAITGDAALGGKLYAENCASCHGAKGEGVTGTALGNATMLALTPDGFLRHAIVNGREGTAMVGFKDTLSDTEIDALTAFLRSRSGGWTVETPVLRAPPQGSEYVLHPDGAAPELELSDGRYVSAKVLDRELKAGKRMVLLDTRVTSMWQRAHIAGAVPLPYYSGPDEVIANLPTDGTWIVAYCECPRAAADSVVKQLREIGYANTAVLYEGIQGWISLGYPVVAGTTQVVKVP
ncbi:c-type cytochrome [Arenimonas sp. MALMAid1274]|uniref:c-type cytochrome n=1 Tax=Arenimonas sp. MALMAid1274 TaxID=3411630 RepID=UPI003B9F515D